MLFFLSPQRVQGRRRGTSGEEDSGFLILPTTLLRGYKRLHRHIQKGIAGSCETAGDGQGSTSARGLASAEEGSDSAEAANGKTVK